MNLLKALKADHQEMKRLWTRIESEREATPRKAMKSFVQLANLLKSHSGAEESALYDRLKREGSKAHEKALEGHEEHHVADVVVAELKMLALKNELWGPKFAVLKSLLMNHIKEEESTVFEIAKKKLDSKELDKAGQEFLSERKGAQRTAFKGKSQPADKYPSIGAAA